MTFFAQVGRSTTELQETRGGLGHIIRFNWPLSKLFERYKVKDLKMSRSAILQQCFVTSQKKVALEVWIIIYDNT